MQELLKKLLIANKSLYTSGKVADYIPDLAKVDPKLFGIYVMDINKRFKKYTDVRGCHK